VFGSDQADAAVFKRIARRVEEILEAARQRERKGQRLSLEIDARFQLHDMGAVQFQLASAILEEVGGMDQEEVVSELLSLGLAAVLDSAARAAQDRPEEPEPRPEAPPAHAPFPELDQRWLPEPHTVH
jgi:hypothetical protein